MTFATLTLNDVRVWSQSTGCFLLITREPSVVVSLGTAWHGQRTGTDVRIDGRLGAYALAFVDETAAERFFERLVRVNASEG